MAKIDYAALKKGGFMRQKQKGFFFFKDSGSWRKPDSRKY